MEDLGVFVLLGFVLVALALSLGFVIGWFKYRRYGADVDYGTLGIGFLIAGAVALLILLPTDGPWIVGITFMGVGAVYLATGRRVPGIDTDRTSPGDRTEGRDTSASTEVTEPSGQDASRSRIEVGDRVLLTADVELPRRDHDRVAS